MDIEQYRKSVTSRMQTAQIKKQVKSTIEDFENQRIIGYEASKLQHRPIVETLERNQEDINNRQNKLIKQMQENKQTITSGLKDIVESNRDIYTLNNELPFSHDALEYEQPASQKTTTFIPDFDGNLTEKDLQFITDEKLDLPSRIFNDGLVLKAGDNQEVFNDYLNEIKNIRDLLAKENNRTSVKGNTKEKKGFQKEILSKNRSDYRGVGSSKNTGIWK